MPGPMATESLTVSIQVKRNPKDGTYTATARIDRERVAWVTHPSAAAAVNLAADQATQSARFEIGLL